MLYLLIDPNFFREGCDTYISLKIAFDYFYLQKYNQIMRHKNDINLTIIEKNSKYKKLIYYYFLPTKMALDSVLKFCPKLLSE